MRDPRRMAYFFLAGCLLWWILSTHSACPSISMRVDPIHPIYPILKTGYIEIGSSRSLHVHANTSRVAVDKEIADHPWDDSSAAPCQPRPFYDLRFNKRVNFILDLPDVEVRVEAQKFDLPDNSEEAFITISTKRDENRKAKIVDDNPGWRNKLTTVGFFCKEIQVIIRVDISADPNSLATTSVYGLRPTHLRVNIKVKKGDYFPPKDREASPIHQSKPQPPFAQEDPKISLIGNDFRRFENRIVRQMPIRNTPVQAYHRLIPSMYVGGDDIEAGLLTTANHNHRRGTSRHDLGSLSTQTRGSDTLTREAWQELEREKEKIDKISKWLVLIVLCLGLSFMVWILLFSLKYPWNKVEPVMEYAKLFMSLVTIPICIYRGKMDPLANLKEIPFNAIQFMLMRLRNFDIKSYRELQNISEEE